MPASTLAVVALLATSVFSYPLQQGSIADIAGGDAPNGKPPASISDTAVSFFQAVNFLENLESAFFEQGLQNLTNSWNHDRSFDPIVEIVQKCQAQEEIHIKTATNILTHFNKQTFKPCTYQFPVTTAEEFLLLANTITVSGIGAVINGASTLAFTDPGLVPGPASIIGAEARHDAAFRAAALHVVPNPTPFETRISGLYALNLASKFIVPGSCGDNMPKFKTIPSLTAKIPKHVKITGVNKPITFTFDDALLNPQSLSGKTLYVGWVNQVNVVNFVPAKLVEGTNKVETMIPGGLANVAFAALTAGTNATDVNQLTDITLAGPAPVQIS